MAMSSGFRFKKDVSISSNGVKIDGKTASLEQLKALVRSDPHNENCIVVFNSENDYRGMKNVRAIEMLFSEDGVEVNGVPIRTAEELSAHMRDSNLSFEYKRPNGFSGNGNGHKR